MTLPVATSLDVVTKKIDDIVKDYKLLPKQVAICSSRALNRTAVFVAARLASDVAKKKKVKVRAVKNLIRVARGSVSQNYRTLLIDTRGILVRDLGNLKQTDHGVSVGGTIYNKHSFIASLKGGRPGVYRRLTKDRFPVKSIRVPVYNEIVESLAEVLGLEAVEFFEKRFVHELHYMVSRGIVT